MMTGGIDAGLYGLCFVKKQCLNSTMHLCTLVYAAYVVQGNIASDLIADELCLTGGGQS